jgi:hypothetical protein
MLSTARNVWHCAAGRKVNNAFERLWYEKEQHSLVRGRVGLSCNVLAGVGFLCDKGAALSVEVTETPCTIQHLL